jgi:hypothetical protein
VIAALTFATYAVTLDGEPMLPRARAAVVSGRVLLPVRALGNALGASVSYDGRAHAIVVRRGPRVATLPARGAVRIVNGTAYAPLRAAASAFGLAVAYDRLSRTIALSGGSSFAEGPLPAAQAAVPTRPPTTTIIVQPSPGAQVHDPYPAVTARFAGAASIDPSSLRVIVDGRDVSSEAAVVGDEVLWTPRRVLQPGTHAISVRARDASGTPLAQDWSFDDSFAFAAPPPAPTPFPVTGIWIDRWVTPGTNAFDVYVQGAPGITGMVGVDGVPGFFPLQVYSANGYVAHVFVPVGVNQPFARVAARLTLPNGTVQTIVLPQRITVITPPPPGPPAQPVATPHRMPRVPLGTGVRVPAATPLPPAPRVTPAPGPTPTPRPRPVVRPLATAAARSTSTPVALPNARPTPATTPSARPTPVPTPTPVPIRVRVRPSPKPTPVPRPSITPG